MDAQLKKGILDSCVLATLTRGDNYGYELLKEISKVVDVSESTLYPILRRLEKADCLTTYNVEHESRIRKYYKISKAGKDKLEKFCNDWKQLANVYEFIIQHLSNS